MHAKVDEVYHLVAALKRRHDESNVVKYADQPILTEDIRKIFFLYSGSQLGVMKITDCVLEVSILKTAGFAASTR